MCRLVPSLFSQYLSIPNYLPEHCTGARLREEKKSSMSRKKTINKWFKHQCKLPVMV